MFGYVIANPEGLTEEQMQRYRACYCGLCHAIHQEFSSLSRLSLNYDMTFLVLLLTSLYEPLETNGCARCIAHPVKSHGYWISPYTRYCAAMNVALAYYNCLDDWLDDRNVVKLAQAQLFRSARRRTALEYPRQISAIQSSLRELAELEAAGVPNPDGTANAFAHLMGEMFVIDESDHWASTLRTVGAGLGRFIYILDAAVDLEADLKNRRYNPLSAMANEGKTLVDFRDYLTLLIGECTTAFEQLPLVQDAALLRNILYSGVWARYEQALDKLQATTEGGPSL